MQKKTFENLQPPFTIKTDIKLGIPGTHINIIKVTYDKLTANIIFNDETFESFCLNSEKIKDSHCCHFFVT